MFFPKSLVASAVLLLSLSLQAHAHAAISPVLGLAGAPKRADVQRPSTAKPCGKTALTAIDSSTAVQASANGSFAATITNFNAGRDGSRQVTATIDADGTGKNFVKADVLQNGDLNPTSTGSQQLVVQIPAGTTCTGGASGTKCLVSFVTAGKFGNCVVVDQAGAASTGAAAGNNAAGTGAAAGTNSTATDSTGAADNSTVTAVDTATATAVDTATATDSAATSTSTTTGRKHKQHKGAKGAKGAAAQNGTTNAAAGQNGTANATDGQAAAAGQNQAAQANSGLAKLKQIVDALRSGNKSVGTRAARIARRAAERPAVEVLA